MIDVGSRRELFVDDYLIQRLDGARLVLHPPEPGDVAIVCDQPWEGNTSAYYTIFQDGDVIRMYYRGAHWDEERNKAAHVEFACYAESADGLTFRKPKLGLFEFQGSKDNNIVAIEKHNFTPFKDTNPACVPDARYKALATGATTVDGKPKACLDALKSADGIRWSVLKEAVITDGAFDSQNLAFWCDEQRRYLDFHRKGRDGIRDIMTCSSTDFLTWTDPEFLDHGDAPREHLYTNAIEPYFRAPHLFLGFPTRFQPKTQQVEPIFMTSRDGKRFRRWPDALIPITAPKDRDGNRSNYMTRGLIQTPGNERELSVYATEAYYKGPGSRVRRFTFRTDGFVSVRADGTAELLTRPLRFTGKAIQINARTSDHGSVRLEMLSEDHRPLAGFGLADSVAFRGDKISHTLAWQGGSSVESLAGKTVRLRFELKDADLFSMQAGTGSVSR